MNRYQMLINALHVVLRTSHEEAVLECVRRALVEAGEPTMTLATARMWEQRYEALRTEYELLLLTNQTLNEQLAERTRRYEALFADHEELVRRP